MQQRLALKKGAQAIVAGVLVLLPAAAVLAAAFTPDDIVVYRVGDGAAGLVNTGNAVFLDEYTPAGAPVQSIALPTTVSGSNNQLIASGTAGSEGLLTRSANGQYLLLTGYARNLGGSTSLSGTAATTVPRTVARVKFDGSIDTSTALTDFATANNPRSATSTDGLDIWVAGGAGGVRYTRYSIFGSTSSTQLSTASTNIEQASIFDGQLYISTQKNSLRVATVGSGTPTASGQTITNLPGFPTTGNPDAFFLADLDGSPGFDTLYVADDTANGGEIQKYALVDGSWIAVGTIAAADVHGVTGVVDGAIVTLYATASGSAGTSGTLSAFTDSTGYNAAVSGTASTLVSALANETFRGVALAPVSSLVATPTWTSTATLASTPASTATNTPVQVPTAAPSATQTSLATATPPQLATITDTPAEDTTATPSATQTPTFDTPTNAPSTTDTPTALATATDTPTVSATPAEPGAAFTPGDIVVYRVGDGTAALTNNGNAVFLDEYTPGGTLVQSIALPTTASGSQNQLIATSDVSEGLLARSTDGQYVLLTGYATDLGGSTALATTTATAVPRTVGRVKFDGTIDTSTGLTDMSSANNVRSATSSNGTDLWVGGASGSSGGVHYTTLGSTTSTQLFATIPKGVRQVDIFDGQLYFDSNTTGLLNVSTVGEGTPTTAGQSGAELPGLPDTAGNDGYYFADLGNGHGLATLYVANDSVGEILKYALVSGSWTASGTITAAGVHGVTGLVSEGTVILYATGTTGTDGTLYSFTDTTGYGGTVAGTATTLVTAPANQTFRGVALAPVVPVTLTPTVTTTPTHAPVPTETAAPGSTATPVHTSTATPQQTPIGTQTPTPPPTVTGTATHAPTSTATPTPVATIIPTATAIPCVGDCDRNGDVTVNELLAMVNIALGNTSLPDCTAGDADAGGDITVNEILLAVNRALTGCTAD